ncbi:hypothetical protein BDV35DRAFT_14996 [Aspergillus flavus]|uniref:Uncharacterized protein n=1 Tax=Aspergillus flavus TaxID=5059 RepID=A0A5N6GLZ3_ASPFL|nr:hypothetical protein BDV35DRAFT_14996 [Aspergillus flavus]KAJ1713428.1 hypothetical protein NYO67_4444 [Aspergillus flavus]
MFRPSLALQAAISSHTDRSPGRSAAILDYAVFSSWRSKWVRRSPRCWANREGWLRGPIIQSLLGVEKAWPGIVHQWMDRKLVDSLRYRFSRLLVPGKSLVGPWGLIGNLFLGVLPLMRFLEVVDDFCHNEGIDVMNGGNKEGPLLKELSRTIGETMRVKGSIRLPLPEEGKTHHPTNP